MYTKASIRENAPTPISMKPHPFPPNLEGTSTDALANYLPNLVAVTIAQASNKHDTDMHQGPFLHRLRVGPYYAP